MEYYVLVHKRANSRTEREREGGGRDREIAVTLWCGQIRNLFFPLTIFTCPEMLKFPGIIVVSLFS